MAAAGGYWLKSVRAAVNANRLLYVERHFVFKHFQESQHCISP